MSIKQNPVIVNAALLTVCVEPDIVPELAGAAESLRWMVNTAEFGAYVSDARRPHITHEVRTAEICIAVIDFDEDPDQAAVSIAYLQQVFQGKLCAVAISGNLTPSLLLRAMRAGCTEFIHKQCSGEELVDVFERLDRQRTTTSLRSPASGSVLSFFGAKGGVGSTTLAVHVALYLRQVHGKKTLLIDNHPELGHVCVYLGIDGSRYNFNELIKNVGRLDSDLLNGFTAKHSSGLEVLSSPDVCGSVRTADAETIVKLLEFLRTEYDYVVVDCATALDEINLAVIDSSTHVYLVATPEIGAVRDLSRYVDNLMRIDYTTEKMHVVINRFSSRYAVNVEHIEKAIHLPVEIKLPNSYVDLVRAVNLGEPVAPQRKTEFSTQIVKWTTALAGAHVAAAGAGAPKALKSKPLFGFLGKNHQASAVGGA